jgi:hypothetical protein
MKTAFAFLALVAVVAGQRYVDPKQAAILNEARYLSGDGSFGAAYNQEDGTQFKEETDAQGNRRGQYSYIGDDGKTITVQYTAGKNGFQVSGDHLPRAPIAPQAPAPAPQYNQQPQYNAVPNQGQSYNKGSNNGDDGSYRADVYEAPYQYRNELHTTNYPSQAPAQQPQQANFQNYHHSLNNPAQQQQQFQQTTTTPSPNRFFPPGKLNLNRTPDGFQYTFQSN